VLENGMGAKARRLLGSVIWNIEQDSTILDSPVLRAGLDEMLLNIITALPNNYSDDLAGNYQRSVAPVVVRMVEEFIEAHATEPISVSDLIALCKCSRAKLFNSFRHFRGYTPMQFLAECRLKSAHEALRFPTPSDTIASIAHACGFSHLGRFSVAYRRRYSENPSATLQKNGSSGMSRVKPK
jgi:AraC-like DNA-binding protein